MDVYEAWMERNRENPRRRQAFEEVLAKPRSRLVFSVIVPVYSPPLEILDEAIKSVLDQEFESFELILVDDASPDSCVRPALERWSAIDSRVRTFFRTENGNISVATNQAANEARGEFLVFLDHDDLLAPDALAHLALYLDEHPSIDLVYTDDDKIDQNGRRDSPQFKPGWSPELLLSFCYTAHLSAVRTVLYQEIGGMRQGFEGSQDHDFWLRASEKSVRVGHIPQVLYHWRILRGSTASSGHAKPGGFEAGRRAVEEAFTRRGVDCAVKQPDWAFAAGCAIFQPVMPDDGPSVAIVIPTQNNDGMLQRLLHSLSKTTYKNYLVYIIQHDDDPETLASLATSSHTAIRIPGRDARFRFSLSALNNTAARMVREDLLLFLSADIEVIDPRWLSQMVGWSRLEGVGAVGARLLYPDRRVQHGGIIKGVPGGLTGHAFRSMPWWDGGTMSLSRVTRNCLSVTAACMLTPRSLYLNMGGFDEDRFAVAFNDVDYGYRLIDAGYRCVFCSEAELVRHLGVIPKKTDAPGEKAAFREAYGDRSDPYFNPHLDPDNETLVYRPTVVPVRSCPRKIALLAATHNLNWEGAPLIQFELLSRLKEQGAISPLVMSPSDGPLRAMYEKQGIPIEVDASLQGVHSVNGYSHIVDRLSERLAMGGFEVVHSNTLRAFWAIHAARKADVPSVWSVHESEPWSTYFNDLPPEVAASALSCLAHPYRVIFASRSSRECWQALESRANYALIPTPLDVARFQSLLANTERGLARASLGLSEQEICVLLIGTVCERKGQHDLVHAFASLPSDVVTRMRCVVVGARDGLAYSLQLRGLVKKLPEDRRERFLLIPETARTADYWQAADIFCCTSRIESYPRVILEAMALGLPILTTPVNGITEQVSEGVNALFYQPGDIASLALHLGRLVSDHALRASFAEQSPWVLRSLPSHADMLESYLCIFRAAAESAAVRLDCSPARPAEAMFHREVFERQVTAKPETTPPPHNRGRRFSRWTSHSSQR